MPLSLYIHIPFCAKHCAYCDFNTYVERQEADIVERTVVAICTDISRSANEISKRSVATVFFGGGTPTLLGANQITRILETVRNCFDIESGAEISSEANPGSSDAEKFAAMRAAGFNRLSIGVQSFNNRLLQLLDRFHSTEEANAALNSARSAGFTNVNLDLMFGLPGQTLDLWQQSLDTAASKGVEHLSLYALTLEPGTRFERLYAGGKLELPDEDSELEMYERSIDQLTAAGYEHYEVSNFALPGHMCRHNLVYWHNEEYLGVGPGAVSYLKGRRFTRERLPARYCNAIDTGSSVEAESECVDAHTAMGETMMLGLRLREGISADTVEARFGIDPIRHFEVALERLIAQGLLTLEHRRLRLTHRGLLLANTALAEFLP